MTDIKLIIVEHLIKMHCDAWKCINSKEYNDRDDDRRKAYNLIQRIDSIEHTLKDIALSENGISPKQKGFIKSKNEPSHGAL